MYGIFCLHALNYIGANTIIQVRVHDTLHKTILFQNVAACNEWRSHVNAEMSLSGESENQLVQLLDSIILLSKNK